MTRWRCATWRLWRARLGGSTLLAISLGARSTADRARCTWTGWRNWRSYSRDDAALAGRLCPAGARAAEGPSATGRAAGRAVEHPAGAAPSPRVGVLALRVLRQPLVEAAVQPGDGRARPGQRLGHMVGLRHVLRRLPRRRAHPRGRRSEERRVGKEREARSAV